MTEALITEVRMSQSFQEQMIEHCLAGRPNEACGLLGAKSGTIVKVFALSNASASPVRYSLDPKEQFTVYRELEERDWELGGVFHSHTRTDAYPSPTDIRQASEVVPYLIVSLATEAPNVRAYLIIKDNWTDEEGEVREIPVVVEA